MDDNLDKPKSTTDIESLSKIAYSYLLEQQENVEVQYGIHQYEDWYYDQEIGLLTFAKYGKVFLEIEYEEVGSISTISNTWLWSWANHHVDRKVSTDIEAVRQYGLEKNIEHLIKRKWRADEYDGWEMTAISAYLMHAKGAYRFPLENTFSFVIYKNIRDLR